MSHYYTNDIEKSNPHKITFLYKGHTIVYKSDHGVFSRQAIDFGTRTLLDSIEVKGKSLLDVGCGYGTIGIALKTVYPELEVDMIDVNLRALSLARENSSHLDINIYESNIYEHVSKTFDMIVSNPPVRAGKKIVHQILKESIHYLNDQGKIVIVLQKKQGAPSAIKLLKETFGNANIIKRNKGYYIIESIKNTAV